MNLPETSQISSSFSFQKLPPRILSLLCILTTPKILPSSETEAKNHKKISSRISTITSTKAEGKKMDARLLGLEAPLFHTLQHVFDAVDDADKAVSAPTRTYVRDAKAMAATPADVKEYPSSYVFIVDMPGLKSGDIKVQVEDKNVLIVSGERKREEEKEAGAKYVRMERRVGKFMRKFVLPENANADAVSAVCQDGVLTVTVQKLPPPEPKKPKTIEVKIA